MEMSVLKLDRFEFRINKVVPNSDPSVVNLRIFENGIYSCTISMTLLETLELAHTLIGHVIEPEGEEYAE